MDDDGIQNAWKKKVLMTTAMSSAARMRSGSSSQNGSAGFFFSPTASAAPADSGTAGSESGNVTGNTLPAGSSNGSLTRRSQVFVPEHSRRCRSKRSPSGCPLVRLLDVGDEREVVDPSHRDLERPITRWPDVGSTESEQQVAGRRPRADPSNVEELLRCSGIFESADRVEVDRSIHQTGGDSPCVASFLSRESDRSEVRVIESDKRFWIDSADRSFELLKRSVCGRERYLLFQDEANHCGESGVAWPQRRNPVAIREHRQNRVHRRQGGDCRGECCIVKWRDNDPPSRRVVFDCAVPVDAGQSRFSLIRVALPTRSRR